ncbi:glycosyltransferase family 4 protein [Bradyrhizobium sp. LHD-71]|uniref:glycosyltransferase family 4 protein n=1 Tax=Bradyrhizobium sp. LHD-71 TaxID=3072141 RepID=UPI0028106028|nr:glycosyltransferase family 4 protein [Bradyrhizobium sp. LHD-71]MDQ8726115.1 glycosyltransferase family 4 protein [Bradyrhizobium sp. LHD-71]
MALIPPDPLRILHAVRAPVGGIFRHILDLAQGQIERGHQVGILADSLTGGERAKAALADMEPRLALGVHRIAIRREPHPADLMLVSQFNSLIRRAKPHVLHGHGAKAGAFIRTKGRAENLIRVYTPHGGSLHYGTDTLKGRIYAGLELALMNRTDLFLFESQFARNTYERLVGTPKGLVRCVFNGVTAKEFDPLVVADDATDVAYVGEFRHIKGADILIEAVARLRAAGRPVTLTLGGDGEETASLRALCAKLNLDAAARFIGHVPARFGFSKGRLLVVPSRGDSMPYVVIEAAAAGVPMIASNVGGIPEIFGPFTDGLVRPGDPDALAAAIASSLDNPDKAHDRAKLLRERVFSHFSQRAMVDGVLASYREAFADH